MDVLQPPRTISWTYAEKVKLAKGCWRGGIGSGVGRQERV